MSTFTDLSSAVAKAFAATNKVIIKDPANELNWGFNTVEEIKDYVVSQYPNPFQYFRGFTALLGANITIGEGYYGVYYLPNFVKTYGLFVKGTGNGCLYAAMAKNVRYFGYLIIETATGDLDYFIDISPTCANIPAGWTMLKMLHSFVTNTTTVLPLAESFKQPIEIDAFGLEGLPLPKDYCSKISVFSKVANNIVLDAFHCRDSSNSVNFESYATSLLDISSMLDDTQYYVFIVKNNGGSPILELSTSSTNAGTTYAFKKLIGFIQTYDYSGSNQYNFWTIFEKWDDENFDISSIAKSNSIEADAPSYEDLFSTGIKAASFSASATNQISGGVEFAHDGQNDSYIQWHAHLYPENTNTGNVVIFVDYAFIKDGDVINAAAVTRLTKTVAMSGIAGKAHTISFAPSTGDLEEGTQIWFRFGRLGADGADTFTGKLAVRTFGFHYIREKLGSDLMLTNL
jgi:hypothetical protein